MKFKVDAIRKLCRVLYSIVVCFLIVSMVEVIYIKQPIDVWPWLAVTVIYIISAIVAEKAPNYFWLMFVHIVMGVAVCVIPFKVPIRITLLMMVIMRIPEVYVYAKIGRKIKPLGDAPWPSMALTIVAFLFGRAMKSAALISVSYTMLLFMLIIYFLEIYLEGLNGYLSATRNVNGIPTKRIIKVSNSVVIAVIALFALGIGLAYICRLDVVFKLVFNLVKDVAVIVVSGVFIALTFLGRFASTSDPGVYKEGNSKISMDADYSYVSAEILELLLRLGVILIAAFVIIKFVKWVLKKIFAGEIAPGDRIEKAEAPRKQASVINNKKGLDKKALSREMRLRKYYKQMVMRYRYDIRLKQNSTCRDIENELQALELEEIAEATKMYEKVRYGGVRPDKKMVKKMDELTRR